MSSRGRLAGIDVTDDCMRLDRETKFNISKIDGEDIPTTLTWVFSFPILMCFFESQKVSKKEKRDEQKKMGNPRPIKDVAVTRGGCMHITQAGCDDRYGAGRWIYALTVNDTHLEDKE